MNLPHEAPATAQSNFRNLFPALRRVAWFATPGVAPGATPVVEVLRGALASWQEGRFDHNVWEQEAELAREGFAGLVRSPVESVALMATLAEAASIVAASVRRRWPDGDVVVPAREFRSNLMPWQALQAAGFRVTFVEMGRPQDWTSTIVASIGPRTRLVALSEVQSGSGVRADISAVLQRCREVGAELFLNATQSLGVLEPQSWLTEVDYVAAHGYKWLLAPRGAAWLRVRPDRLDAMQPLVPSWKGAFDARSEMYGPSLQLSATATKLDASLAWFSWVGARVAVEIARSVPARQVEAHAVGMADELREVLRSAGLSPLALDQPSQIVSVAAQRPQELHTQLGLADVATAMRDGRIRLGCHYFNTKGDIDRVARALRGFRS